MSRQRRMPTFEEIEAFIMYSATHDDLEKIQFAVKKALKYRFGVSGKKKAEPTDIKPAENLPSTLKEAR